MKRQLLPDLTTFESHYNLIGHAGGTGLQPMLAAADAALTDQLARQAACLAALRSHVLHAATAEASGRVRLAAASVG